MAMNMEVLPKEFECNNARHPGMEHTWRINRDRHPGDVGRDICSTCLLMGDRENYSTPRMKLRDSLHGYSRHNMELATLAMFDNLTDVQVRCTEQEEELRKLRTELKEYKVPRKDPITGDFVFEVNRR